jgi:voltage-gated potassium channel
MALAIGSIPLLLVELKKGELTIFDQRFLDVVNWVVLVCFVVDYVVELSVVSNRRRYMRSEVTTLVVIIAQALAVLPSLGGLGALRFMRASRVLRPIIVIARALTIGGSAAAQGKRMLCKRAGTFALGVAAMTWVSSAAGFTLVEDVGRDGRVASFFDALWWSSTTITTVGYGDVYPVTAAGRCTAVFTMVVGVSTFAVVTAKVGAFLLRPDETRAITQQANSGDA